MNDLNTRLEQVNDRESFIKFVRALIQDREDEVRKEKDAAGNSYGPDANGWENGTIENYLDAAIAWMEDSLGGENELPPEPSWKSFAKLLYAGKFYE